QDRLLSSQTVSAAPNLPRDAPEPDLPRNVRSPVSVPGFRLRLHSPEALRGADGFSEKSGQPPTRWTTTIDPRPVRFPNKMPVLPAHRAGSVVQENPFPAVSFPRSRPAKVRRNKVKR